MSVGDYIRLEAECVDLVEKLARVRAGIADLQRRYECRETLHTSDFTNASLALDQGQQSA